MVSSYQKTYTLDGTRLSFVDKCMHLSHVLTSDLDDKAEVLHKRNSVCAKVNSVLCHFYKCTPLIKLKLLRAYCSDFYGSTLWNCLLYTSPSPRDRQKSRMPSSA